MTIQSSNNFPLAKVRCQCLPKGHIGLNHFRHVQNQSLRFECKDGFEPPLYLYHKQIDNHCQFTEPTSACWFCCSLSFWDSKYNTTTVVRLAGYWTCFPDYVSPMKSGVRILSPWMVALCREASNYHPIRYPYTISKFACHDMACDHLILQREPSDLSFRIITLPSCLSPTFQQTTPRGEDRTCIVGLALTPAGSCRRFTLSNSYPPVSYGAMPPI